MANILGKIIEGIREDLAVRGARVSYGEIKELSLETPSPVNVVVVLTKPGVQVITGVRRASPSKGELTDIPSPDILAAEYEQGGAAVIPCLTEEHRFRGSLADLDAVRRAVNIPVLRKDFIVTPYQAHETRAHGADLVLLVCSALDQPTLESLLDHTEPLGMSALVEARTAKEIERAGTADARILGINACNLKTLDVDLSVYEHLAPMLPDHIMRVAESGVKRPEELRCYAFHSADTMLVGEGLVTAGKPGEACRRLVAADVHLTLRSEQ